MNARSFLAITCATLLPVSLARAGDSWPQFRGPTGHGVSDATGLPVEWGEDENVTWKTAIHGKAWSSPVIHGKQVWLTTATEDGRQLSAVCVDKDSGKIVHDLRLFDVAKPQYAHPFNSYASPTPVIEGTGFTSASARPASPASTPARARWSGSGGTSCATTGAGPAPRRC